MDIDEKVSGPGGASQKNWTHLNETNELPLDMRFNHGHMVSITVYSVLMVISATGNLTVLSQLVKRRRAKRASRLDVLLMHLAVADLMVTFLMMPLEIAWAGTVQWLAGDLMCRLMMFTRTFGLYLSSFVLICIAIDRYYAILKPLNVTWEARVRRALTVAWVCAGLASLPQSFIFHLGEHPEVKGYYAILKPPNVTWEARVRRALTVAWVYAGLASLPQSFIFHLGEHPEVKGYNATLKPLNVTWEARVRRALTVAWVCAELASLPQSFIFHLGEHPEVKGYYQCVSYGSLPTERHEFAYFLVNMTLMYIAPLVSTLYCSSAALLEIIRRANTSNDKMRRSGVGILGRARARTLKMTVTIVLVFFTCWSPYYFYCLWYWIDKDTLKKLDPAIQKGMWLFSCTNSCANPIVYGVFNRNRWTWNRSNTNRFGNGSLRRGSRLPYGESMEISAAALARARSSVISERTGRRDSAFASTGSKGSNGSNSLKHFHNNNNHFANGMV